jgi:hypothetical protein
MKRNSLTTAVVAGIAGVAGFAGLANAVDLNPDGLGQVLIYPYYTVNKSQDTLLSVVNTTSVGKAVKVRFLEGYNSREVLDFNLFLSPFDVWTAAVSQVSDDGGAQVYTADKSCIDYIPSFPYPFSSAAYTGGVAGPGDRTMTPGDTALAPTTAASAGTTATVNGQIKGLTVKTVVAVPTSADLSKQAVEVSATGAFTLMLPAGEYHLDLVVNDQSLRLGQTLKVKAGELRALTLTLQDNPPRATLTEETTLAAPTPAPSTK